MIPLEREQQRTELNADSQSQAVQGTSSGTFRASVAREEFTAAFGLGLRWRCLKNKNNNTTASWLKSSSGC